MKKSQVGLLQSPQLFLLSQDQQQHTTNDAKVKTRSLTIGCSLSLSLSQLMVIGKQTAAAVIIVVIIMEMTLWANFYQYKAD